MSSANEIEVVLMEEARHDGRSEGIADAAIVLAPVRRVLVRVGPQQITEKTGIWNVGGTHDATDLLHGLQVRTEATMTAENLLVDYGRHRQTVEAIGEGLP